MGAQIACILKACAKVLLFFETRKLFRAFFLYFVYFVFFGYVSLPICYNKRCKGESDYQSDESEHGTPYRQREQQYRRVEPHCLTHYFGNDNCLGDNLYKDEQSYSQAEYIPEVLSRVGCFEHGEECGGY